MFENVKGNVKAAAAKRIARQCEQLEWACARVVAESDWVVLVENPSIEARYDQMLGALVDQCSDVCASERRARQAYASAAFGSVPTTVESAGRSRVVEKRYPLVMTEGKRARMLAAYAGIVRQCHDYITEVHDARLSRIMIHARMALAACNEDSLVGLVDLAAEAAPATNLALKEDFDYQLSRKEYLSSLATELRAALYDIQENTAYAYRDAIEDPRWVGERCLAYANAADSHEVQRRRWENATRASGNRALLPA